jgi:hypothetical protein
MGDYFAEHDAWELLATPYDGDLPFGKGPNGF